MIRPINGLEMANQNGIASPKIRESRLRMREGVLVTRKGVVRPVPQLRDSSGNPYRELIALMRLGTWSWLFLSTKAARDAQRFAGDPRAIR